MESIDTCLFFSALLFNDLICCVSDVQLLKSKKVIVDHLNMSNQYMVNLCRFMARSVDRDLVGSTYKYMIMPLTTIQQQQQIMSYNNL